MSDSQDTPAAADAPPMWRAAAPCVALFAAALYAVTLGGTYVYDDFSLLVFDDRAAHPSRWLRYLTESYNDGVDHLYRPLTSLTFALQVWLHGTSQSAAWAYHAVNLLLYAVVCAQAAALAGRLAGAESRDLARFAAWSVGLLFAAHPVHAEAVAGIAGRAELLCASGFLGGLLVVSRPLTRPRVAAFVACLFLAIGGKEQGLLLPAVAACWYAARWWAGRPVGTSGLGKPLLASVALPLAAYLVWRESILPMAWTRSLLDPSIQPMILASGTDRLLMPLAILGRYAGLLVWPRTLVLDYGASVIAPPQSSTDPFLWTGVAVALLFVVAAGHAARKRWVGGLVALGGLALTYGVISNSFTLIGTVFGERLVFLPSFFFVLYAVLLCGRLFPDRRRIAAGVVALLVLAGGVRTLTYAVRWNDRLSLYADQVEARPDSVRLWMLYGDLLRQEGRLDEAAEAGRRATDVVPDYWGGWLLRANVALAAGRLESAKEYAERAVDLRHLADNVAKLDEILKRIRERDAATQPAP